MYKKLVRYEQWHFAEVDPVRLRRKAQILRDQIIKKINPDNDQYQFYRRTLPVVDAAIRGEITESLNKDVTRFISGNFDHDVSEGTLPNDYDQAFRRAVAGFSVTAEALSLEESQHELVDGVDHKWMDCEEESDWPDKMPYP